MPKCDQCLARATRGVTDSIEIPSKDPNGWRQFKESAARNGCDDHIPSPAMTHYLDGRVIQHDKCVPEKVQVISRCCLAPIIENDDMCCSKCGNPCSPCVPVLPPQ